MPVLVVQVGTQRENCDLLDLVETSKKRAVNQKVLRWLERLRFFKSCKVTIMYLYGYGVSDIVTTVLQGWTEMLLEAGKVEAWVAGNPVEKEGGEKISIEPFFERGPQYFGRSSSHQWRFFPHSQPLTFPGDLNLKLNRLKPSYSAVRT